MISEIAAAALVTSLIVSCNPGWEGEANGRVAFAVFDVGEGLAQAVIVDGNAVLFDLGLPEEFPKWKEQFEGLERPFIRAIVISHDHLDHYGGLEMLDSGAAWTGLLITGPHADTAFLRFCAPQWRTKIRFRIAAADDTLALLDGVELRCLWPPYPAGGPLILPDSLKNRFSMVFSVTCGLTRALITSDIDTVAGQELSVRYASGLASDILVVPHHGSAGSLDPVLYGYIRPGTAIISCGAGNQYGHPSPQVLQWLSKMGISTHLTSQNGGAVMESNGCCWNR